MFTSEKIIDKCKEQNITLLREFASFLKNSGLSRKTIKSHFDNIDFFSDYLVYYEPYHSLYEVSAGDVNGFLGDYFPRKALWACPTNVKSYIATFKKFFKWMVEKNYISTSEQGFLLELIKEEKDDWIDSVSFDDEYY